jgi:hypothetical protein
MQGQGTTSSGAPRKSAHTREQPTVPVVSIGVDVKTPSGGCVPQEVEHEGETDAAVRRIQDTATHTRGVQAATKLGNVR